VIGDADYRAELRSNAKTSAKRFGLPEAVARYDQVMTEVIA
jgi:hypothetical protein